MASKEIERGKWWYYIYVSPEAIKNPKRAHRECIGLTINDYNCGWYNPLAYECIADAKKALAYYGKGHVYKRRHIVDRSEGIRSWCEEKIVATA
ncbi:MAG: hypothetical protein LBH06_07375 [Rikenellaceae bacterium]|jgi:hypothetical protein|nr:hypothetical protein [Rikenellaceae bacterium]